MSKEIKAVIIGFAHMHVNEISLYIKEEKSMKLVGCADIAPELPEPSQTRYTRAWNMKNVCSQHGLEPYESYTAMLDEQKPDIAFILCENAKKPEAARECALRGVSMSIEKPMAADLAGALEISALAEKYGVEIVVNWPTTWRAHMLSFKALYDARPVGELIKLRYVNGHTGPLGAGARHRGVEGAAEALTDAERSKMWWYRASPGGGAFLDMHCYGCMYSRQYIDQIPTGVTAVGMNLNTPYCETEDNTAAIISYPSALSVVEGTWTTPNAAMPAGPVLYCKNGVLYLEKKGSGIVARAMDICGAEVALPEIDAPGPDMKHMPAHFAAHALENKPFTPTVTLARNVQTMALLDAAVRSSASGKTEKVREELWSL